MLENQIGLHSESTGRRSPIHAPTGSPSTSEGVTRRSRLIPPRDESVVRPYKNLFQEMTSSDQPRSVLCLGLADGDRSRVSEEAHRFGWLIRFAANTGDARATGNGRKPDLILFDTKTSDEAAHDLLRQCTAHPLQAVATAPIQGHAPVQEPEPTVADGTVLLEPGSIHRFEDYEQQILRHALHTTGWNVKRAAQLLGIGRATLYRKIDRYKLRDYQPERNAG